MARVIRHHDSIAAPEATARCVSLGTGCAPVRLPSLRTGGTRPTRRARRRAPTTPSSRSWGCGGKMSRATRHMSSSWTTVQTSSTSPRRGCFLSNRSAGRDLGKAQRTGRGVFRRAAGTGASALHPGERLPELRASRSARAGSHRPLSLTDLPVHVERSEARSTLDRRCHHGADADVRNGNGPRRRPAARKTKRPDEALWSGCAFSIT